MIRRMVLTVVGLVVLSGFVTPISVSAATDPFEAACQGVDSAVCKADGGDPITGEDGALVAVVSILAAVAGIVSIISLIWGGIKYITSNGDSSSIASAKQAVFAALIGLVIALMARPIVLFVVGKI